MYGKLAFRNMKRSIKDYIIYFITLTLAIALMFSFLSIAFSEMVMGLSENMRGLSSVILVLSLIVTLIVAFTVSYATKFIVTKRKKEFATYLLLGMEQRTASNMFCIENALIGILALVIGILFGSLLSQVFTAVIMNIFDEVYSFQLDLSWKAVLITFICFIIMYGINTLKMGTSIREQKIIELIYSSRLNEKVSMGKPIIYILMLVFSVIVTAISILLFKTSISFSDNRAYLYMFTGFLCITLGLLGTYRSLPYLILMVGNQSKHWKYDGTNLFLLKQLSSKINSTGKMMGILAILLTLALCGMAFGLSMGAMYKVNIKAEAPFDIAVGLDVPGIENFNEVVQFISQTVPVKDYVDYQLYEDDALSNIDILALSDYNKLRQQLGLDEKQITDDQFIIHCDTWNNLKPINEALQKEDSINLGNHTFSSHKSLIFTEPFAQYRINGTFGYAVVLPDFVISQLDAYKSRLVVTTMGDAPQSIKGDLDTFIRKEWQAQFLKTPKPEERITMSLSVKSWSVANALTALSILSFGGLYLSLIFMILVGTILALQQIFNSSKSQYQYRVIRNMGVDDNEIKKLIFSELLIAFVIPLILPVILVIVVSIFANNLFGKFILMENVIYIYTVITLAVFFILYTIYFIATYTSCKRNIYSFITH
ncbi:MAG: ABC transporter permease [Clostridiaceae bacterium]